MRQHVGVGLRKIRDMRWIGIGERIERELPGGTGEQGADPWHLAREDRVPALEELGVGKFDAERAAKCGKELGVAGKPGFVPPKGLVDRKTPRQLERLASGLAG